MSYFVSFYLTAPLCAVVKRLVNHLTMLLCVLIMAVLSSPAVSADQETILIVDGSGSMWGKFDKEHKIVTVRKVLPELLHSYEGKGNLGIMSYGHRWKSNCQDIELIIPMSKINHDKHGKMLAKLSARGKTPITGALKLAYSKFGNESKIRQIILLADGAENCRADPCEFMTDVAKQDKDLTVHVIAYGMGKKDAKKLQCISTISGGDFFRPQSREELNVALTDLFGKTLERQWVTVVKKEPAESKNPGLFLKAWLGKGKLKLLDNVKWLVYKSSDDAINNKAPLLISDKAEAVLQLETGSYYIQLVNDKMGAAKQVEVIKGKHQEVNFRLDAGTVLVKFDAKQDFLDAVKGFRLSLLSARKGNHFIPVVSTQKKEDRFTIPAGRYTLVTELKNIRHETSLSLAAGEKKELKIPLTFGLLSLEAVQSYDGKQVSNLTYRIMRRNLNDESHFEEYFRLASAKPTIVLPVGYYYVEARSDLAIAIENFEITAGQHSHISLNLNAGQISLSSRLSSGQLFHNGEVTYKIMQSGLSAMESQNALLVTSLTERKINLPVGSYIISSLAGRGGSYVEQEIDLEAEQFRTVEFVHQSGYTRFSCVKPDGKKIRRNIFWQIINREGQTVSRSSIASYKVLLEQGSYTAQAQYHGKKYQATFQVSATGEPTDVKVIVQ